MSRRVTALILGLMVAVSFAGAQAQTSIRFFHRWPQEPRKSYYDALVADFEKQNPDIKIVMDSVINDSYKEKIRILVSSNDIPDVFCSWSDTFAYNLVQSGRIQSLNDLLAKDKAFAGTFIQSQLKSFTFGGKVYGLPHTMDAKVFVYNKELFDKAGITKMPANYDELLAMLATLQKKGFQVPLLEGLADPWTISHYLGSMFQLYLPAGVLDKDYAEATGAFTDPGYKVVLQRFQKLAEFMGPNATSMTHTDVRNYFTAGKLPLIYLETGEFKLLHDANPNLKYGYFSFPAFKDGKGQLGLIEGAPEGFMMSSTTKHPAEAARFLKFIYSKAVAQKFMKDIGVPVAVNGALPEGNASPWLQDALAVMNNAKGMVPWFDNAVNIKVGDAFMRGCQAVATKDKTIDQVLADVQAAAKLVQSEAKK